MTKIAVFDLLKIATFDFTYNLIVAKWKLYNYDTFLQLYVEGRTPKPKCKICGIILEDLQF